MAYLKRLGIEIRIYANKIYKHSQVSVCAMLKPTEYMMTSSNGNIFRVTGHTGNSPGTGKFPHQCQWRGTLMFSLICAWIKGWVNNREACDSGRHRAHYCVIVMIYRSDQVLRKRPTYRGQGLDPGLQTSWKLKLPWLKHKRCPNCNYNFATTDITFDPLMTLTSKSIYFSALVED